MYYGETPPASGHLSGAAAQAYDFLIRFRFGAGEPLPSADATVAEEDYAGLLFSAALRLSGVAEGSGRFLRREGANLWVKTAEGRLGLAVDPELPLARRVGDRYFPSATLTLRAGARAAPVATSRRHGGARPDGRAPEPRGPGRGARRLD